MKQYKVYWNNNVECNEVAEFDTLGEAKQYCDENTKSYAEVDDRDNCYEGRGNNFCYEVYEGDSHYDKNTLVYLKLEQIEQNDN